MVVMVTMAEVGAVQEVVLFGVEDEAMEVSQVDTMTLVN